MKKRAKKIYSKTELKHRSKALVGIGAIGLLMAAVSGLIGLTGSVVSNETISNVTNSTSPAIYSLAVGMILVSLIALYIGSKYN